MTHIVHVIFWGGVLFLALSFFGISIEKIVESPAGQTNVAYITFVGLSLWHSIIGFVSGVGMHATSMSI